MELGLKDRVYLVAASSKGLGFGTARALAADGAKVSMCSRNSDDIENAAARLNDEFGAQTIATACDVTQSEDIQKWVDVTVERWGRVDGLLVNAGGPPAAYFKELTDEQWHDAFELTLLSAIRMIRMAIPHMSEGGAIVTITSSSIKEPIERLGLSTVMRAGIAGLVKTLADELAGDNIRVNNLIPGRIDTDRVATLDRGVAKRLNITPQEARQRSLSKIPAGRLGTIDEFGRVGAFLLSPAAAYITGATVRVDGGQMRSI
ncbi:MAG: SDR family oxidoreductase [Anaerolineaceae bacterium]|nr:MAG: SDR family oxidoreductase [Anaerolineaceae bacterium]